jgi:para-nitrobenzyl esterase
MDGSVVRPDQPGKYTLAFQPDGKASARADCNRGSGAFYPGDSGQLTFGMFAVTRAMCPEGSLEPRFWRDLALVRSYLIRDGHLYLSLMADGGIYEFERLV